MSDIFTCENCECVIANETGFTEKHQAYLDKLGDTINQEGVEEEVWGCCGECSSTIAKEQLANGEDETVWNPYIIYEMYE